MRYQKRFTFLPTKGINIWHRLENLAEQEKEESIKHLNTTPICHARKLFSK
jgi:hypothetical protein